MLIPTEVCFLRCRRLTFCKIGVGVALVSNAFEKSRISIPIALGCLTLATASIVFTNCVLHDLFWIHVGFRLEFDTSLYDLCNEHFMFHYLTADRWMLAKLVYSWRLGFCPLSCKWLRCFLLLCFNQKQFEGQKGHVFKWDNGGFCANCGKVNELRRACAIYTQALHRGRVH